MSSPWNPTVTSLWLLMIRSQTGRNAVSESDKLVGSGTWGDPWSPPQNFSSLILTLSRSQRMKGTSRSGVLELEGSGDTELTIALLSGAVVSCPLSLQGVCPFKACVNMSAPRLPCLCSHHRWSTLNGTRTEQGDTQLGISLEAGGPPASQAPLSRKHAITQCTWQLCLSEYLQWLYHMFPEFQTCVLYDNHNPVRNSGCFSNVALGELRLALSCVLAELFPRLCWSTRMSVGCDFHNLSLPTLPA